MAGEIEARFIALMSELFQLDEAEALDFGLYRVIRRHNREVRDFLGEIVTEGTTKRLQGGQLQVQLEQAFTQASEAGRESDSLRLAQLETLLKINPGMPVDEQEAQLVKAVEFRPDDVDEYRSLKATLAADHSGEADRAEVLNRLYQFFSRHYQDGDFIVERRYGKDGARYVKSTGEDTEFHWATEDMYYIKSGDIFTDFPVRLANGQRLVFSVEPESLKATREALKPNDKAHYELANVVKDGDVLRVTLNYQKGTKGADAKKDVIVEAAQKAGAGSGEESAKGIKYWLKCFIDRNQSDFFIHKRLKAALTDDLDIFLKTEVLDADQLLAGGDLTKRAIQVARIVRDVGSHIIDFLAVLEDFQKSLWEKKKLVLETRYVITLDRLARHAPEWLAQNIDHIIEKQRQEWQELGLGDYYSRADCVRVTVGDMATPSTEHYLPLPVDTLHYDAEFKWSMLEAVTAATPLDDALDGVAIQSDNWQALNVLQQKYDRKIQALYADPPYNTDAGPIDYKNGYRKGSWAALIYDRFVLSRNLLQLDGIACATIDDYQQRELHTIMEMIFGVDNRVGTVAIRANPRGRPTKKGLAVAHEYAIFFRNDPSSVLDKVERTAKQQERYKESDEQGVFEWMNFRRQGSNSDRSARWRLYYPIFLTETSLRIPKITWNEAHKEWELHEKPKHGEVVVYPIDEDGNQKTWRWMHDEVTANPDEFQVKDDRSDRRWVYFKYRPNQKGVQATTVWSDARHSATEYGTAIVKKLFGKSAFSYPKSFLAVQDCLKVAGLRDVEGWCIDIFAGSGTTAHAVMVMNADDDGKRKFILVETNKYFDSVTLNRVKKVGASLDWKDGSAEAINGSGVFVRVQSLEQYDDTLENLDTEINQGDSGELAFDDLAFSLRYRLNKTTRTLYCGTERFASPFGYQLKRAVGGGEAQSCEVDLVESLIYLLGMDVSRMFREALGVVILGSNRRGQSVAVFFRECAATDSEQWVKAKLALHPADRVYTNNPAGLGFEGCDRLEAIEAVFATQFGRS